MKDQDQDQTNVQNWGPIASLHKMSFYFPHLKNIIRKAVKSKVRFRFKREISLKWLNCVPKPKKFCASRNFVYALSYLSLNSIYFRYHDLLRQPKLFGHRTNFVSLLWLLQILTIAGVKISYLLKKTMRAKNFALRANFGKDKQLTIFYMKTDALVLKQQKNLRASLEFRFSFTDFYYHHLPWNSKKEQNG